MYFSNKTHATVTRWIEYRTPSGRWSRVRHEVEELDFDAVRLRRFFSVRFSGERRQYSYFSEGYLPYRVTVPSPDGMKRHVTLLTYASD